MMTSLVLSGSFLFHLDTDSPTNTFDTDVESVFSDMIHQITPKEVAASPMEVIPVREVHIANNGLVLLRGARVVSISGLQMRVRVAWNPTHFTWLIQTNVDTKFLTREGERQTFEDVGVGDVVTITGTLGGSGTKPIIHAKFVRQ